jgi:UDP-glucose 4-epimerase
MSLKNGLVLVTGGAGFIGSHLVEELVARGYKVRVLDVLTRGNLDYIRPLIDTGKVEVFVTGPFC